MKKEILKRIAIIGIPGSGKSTFANRLGKQLNIPVYHLDKYVFLENGEKRDHQELINMQNEITAKDSWIIEGCSIKTLDIRFARADTVIYLELPRLLCVWRMFKRVITFREFFSDTGCLKVVNWPLLKYSWNFGRDKNAIIEAAEDRHPHLNFHIFKTKQQVQSFLTNLEGQ